MSSLYNNDIRKCFLSFRYWDYYQQNMSQRTYFGRNFTRLLNCDVVLENPVPWCFQWYISFYILPFKWVITILIFFPLLSCSLKQLFVNDMTIQNIYDNSSPRYVFIIFCEFIWLLEKDNGKNILNPIPRSAIVK